ncbi:MAG: dihydrofolate reductase family protein [Solirubrobacteraceae bacterium]
MARAVYYCAMSLDGFIAQSDDDIAWLTGYEGEYADGERPSVAPYETFLDGIGALVMGSATYRFLLGEMAGGMAWPYSGRPTWVLTTGELPAPAGEDVRIGPGAVPELAGEMLAAAGGRDLWVVGGGNVATQFADAGLLDEVIVTVVPVVLGTGKPLFDRAIAGAPLRLTGTRAFANGMVELRYGVGESGAKIP